VYSLTQQYRHGFLDQGLNQMCSGEQSLRYVKFIRSVNTTNAGNKKNH